MKFTAILFSMLLASSLYAAEPAVTRVVEGVTFVKSGDPGWLDLKLDDGSQFRSYFYYKLIAYEDVKTFNKGEQFSIAFPDKYGVGLLRYANDQFYKTDLSDDHNPINIILSNCLGSNESTVGMANCYGASSRMWDVEVDSLLVVVSQQTSGKVSEKVMAQYEKWVEFKSSYFEAYELHTEETGGSMSIISSAALSNSMRKYYSQLLYEYLR
jgi:hypothetical protein